MHVGISAGHTVVNTQYTANGDIVISRPRKVGEGEEWLSSPFRTQTSTGQTRRSTGNLSLGNKERSQFPADQQL